MGAWGILRHFAFWDFALVSAVLSLNWHNGCSVLGHAVCYAFQACYKDFSTFTQHSLSQVTRIPLGASIILAAHPNVTQMCPVWCWSENSLAFPSWWCPLAGESQWLAWPDEARCYLLDNKIRMVLELIPGKWQQCYVENVPVSYRSMCASRGNVGELPNYECGSCSSKTQSMDEEGPTTTWRAFSQDCNI